MEEKHLIYHHQKLVYTKYGSGSTTVMLLHGFGENASIFKNQIAFLQKYCSLIVPDIPGSGKSATWDLPYQACSIDLFADAMIEILKLESVEKAIVIGHSMGGYITLSMYENSPHFFKGLGLLHSTSFADSDEKKQMRLKGIDTIQNYGAAAFLKATIPNLFAEHFKVTHSEIVQELIEHAASFDNKSCCQYYFAMMNRPDRRHLLQQLPFPLLQIIGTQDIAVPFNDSLQQSHLANSTDVHILENVGHMGMLEATKRVNLAVLEYIHRIEKLFP